MRSRLFSGRAACAMSLAALASTTLACVATKPGPVSAKGGAEPHDVEAPLVRGGRAMTARYDASEPFVAAPPGSAPRGSAPFEGRIIYQRPRDPAPIAAQPAAPFSPAGDYPFVSHGREGAAAAQAARLDGPTAVDPPARDVFRPPANAPSLPPVSLVEMRAQFERLDLRQCVARPAVSIALGVTFAPSGLVEALALHAETGELTTGEIACLVTVASPWRVSPFAGASIRGFRRYATPP